MPDLSPILALPLLQPAQAQKHVTHNEALRLLDVLVQAVVADRSQTLAPAAPQDGTCHIVGPGATGVWAGRDGALAVFIGDGWQFIAPKAGWSAHVLAEGARVTYTGTDWVAASEQALQVARLGISASADATNRLAVSSAATLLNHAGAGHQLKVNKAAAADTASLLFQSGFSGRAEMGLAGADDFVLKVSADGAAFTQALSVNGTTGQVSLPQGLAVAGLVTGSAVMQGDADDTAGRLLRVGAFGVGAPVSLTGATALQDRALRPGLYAYTTGATPGGPETAVWPHSLLVMQHPDLRRAFLSLRTTGDSALRAWFGAQSSDSGAIVWTRLITNETILGAVSQAAGLPTGAIIERASNANGEYVRFADGTQHCTRTDLGAASANLADGSLFRSADVVWTFPAAFAAAPVVTGSADDPETWLSSAPPSATASALRVRSTVAKGGALNIRALACGRWF
ncbi:MAG: DUF2793 domain-containing protein [Paracoccaceae bacterium]|nr:DUF2793 domain-containing protein [Paracoccaceae bacterium]